VLKQPVKLDRPFINAETKRNSGVIISLGAGVAKRSWETEKFLGLIKLILKHTPHHVCLTGGADEIKTAAYLMKHLPAERVDDLTGKTTLTRLIDLTGNSALVIGNETGAIHIAAAAKTKVICILGGGHFGRFAPYPEAIEAAPICLYKKMDCYNCNWNCIYKTAENEPYPCISALSLEEVWDMARRFL
jgi:ADP-heptose:LPS heptosyltransferase